MLLWRPGGGLDGSASTGDKDVSEGEYECTKCGEKGVTPRDRISCHGMCGEFFHSSCTHEEDA